MAELADLRLGQITTTVKRHALQTYSFSCAFHSREILCIHSCAADPHYSFNTDPDTDPDLDSDPDLGFL